MTQTITLWPIIKALLQATLFLTNGAGTPPENWHTEWRATNTTQQLFIQNYLSQHKDIIKFKPDELRAWASKSHQELNDILKKEKFSIQLKPFQKNEFGVVSILDVMMEWSSPGTSKNIIAKKTNKSYAGVHIDHGYTVLTSKNHTHPITRLETKSGDTVWLTIADKPRNDFNLLNYINVLKSNIQEDNNYKDVVFPKIDLDQEPDITWLLNMSYYNYEITQAKQQTKLKMNEFGAHVKSAAAIAVAESCVQPSNKKTLIIDQPFFCWIEKPGISLPIFAGYLDTDVWNDPGTLDMETTTHNKTDALTHEHKQEASLFPQVKVFVNTLWSKVVHLFI